MPFCIRAFLKYSNCRNYVLVWETSLRYYGAPLAVAVSTVGQSGFSNYLDLILGYGRASHFVRYV